MKPLPYTLSDITPIKNWDVSKCTNFVCMFSESSSLSDIKPLQNWDVSKCQIFWVCFLNVHLYQISSLYKIGIFQKVRALELCLKDVLSYPIYIL